MTETITKQYGPVVATIDNETQSATLELRRSGPESLQLMDGEINNVVTWLATILENKGYTVDVAGIVGFEE